MKTLRKILLLTALFHYFLANQLQLYTFIYVQVITFCYDPRGADLCREQKISTMLIIVSLTDLHSINFFLNHL